LIARIWRGATERSRRDEYLAYLERTGVKDYAATPGNRGAYVLARDEGDRTLSTIVSLWESREAIEAFAGPDIERSVYYDEDEQFLVEKFDVEHHDVAARVDPPPIDGAPAG